MRQRYGPSEVEQAIEDAIASLRRGPAVPIQIADLDDAVDAYRSRAYGVAMVLARAASDPLPAKRAAADAPCGWHSIDAIRRRFFLARGRRDEPTVD